MLERTLVKSLGWPEGRLLVLAHEAGTRLAEMGLSGEAILVWLDQVYAEPEKFVNDPALSRLALALLCPHHEKDVDKPTFYAYSPRGLKPHGFSVLRGQ